MNANIFLNQVLSSGIWGCGRWLLWLVNFDLISISLINFALYNNNIIIIIIIIIKFGPNRGISKNPTRKSKNSVKINSFVCKGTANNDIWFINAFLWQHNFTIVIYCGVTSPTFLYHRIYIKSCIIVEIWNSKDKFLLHII